MSHENESIVAIYDQWKSSRTSFQTLYKFFHDELKSRKNDVLHMLREYGVERNNQQLIKDYLRVIRKQEIRTMLSLRDYLFQDSIDKEEELIVPNSPGKRKQLMADNWKRKRRRLMNLDFSLLRGLCLSNGFMLKEVAYHFCFRPDLNKEILLWICLDFQVQDRFIRFLKKHASKNISLHQEILSGKDVASSLIQFIRAFKFKEDEDVVVGILKKNLMLEFTNLHSSLHERVLKSFHDFPSLTKLFFDQSTEKLRKLLSSLEPNFHSISSYHLPLMPQSFLCVTVLIQLYSFDIENALTSDEKENQSERFRKFLQSNNQLLHRYMLNTVHLFNQAINGEYKQFPRDLLPSMIFCIVFCTSFSSANGAKSQFFRLESIARIWLFLSVIRPIVDEECVPVISVLENLIEEGGHSSYLMPSEIEQCLHFSWLIVSKVDEDSKAVKKFYALFQLNECDFQKDMIYFLCHIIRDHSFNLKYFRESDEIPNGLLYLGESLQHSFQAQSPDVNMIYHSLYLFLRSSLFLLETNLSKEAVFFLLKHIKIIVEEHKVANSTLIACQIGMGVLFSCLCTISTYKNDDYVQYDFSEMDDETKGFIVKLLSLKDTMKIFSKHKKIIQEVIFPSIFRLLARMLSFTLLHPNLFSSFGFQCTKLVHSFHTSEYFEVLEKDHPLQLPTYFNEMIRYLGSTTHEPSVNFICASIGALETSESLKALLQCNPFPSIRFILEHQRYTVAKKNAILSVNCLLENCVRTLSKDMLANHFLANNDYLGLIFRSTGMDSNSNLIILETMHILSQLDYALFSERARCVNFFHHFDKMKDKMTISAICNEEKYIEFILELFHMVCYQSGKSLENSTIQLLCHWLKIMSVCCSKATNGTTYYTQLFQLIGNSQQIPCLYKYFQDHSVLKTLTVNHQNLTTSQAKLYRNIQESFQTDPWNQLSMHKRKTMQR